MILLSHPTGNANVRNAALALDENGLLDSFWTSVTWPANSRFDPWISDRLGSELRRRTLPARLRTKVHHSPLREIGRFLAAKVGWEYLYRHERGVFSVDAVYQALDRTVARAITQNRGLRGVYAYEDGASATFAAARRRGLTTIYELPIGYWRAGHAIFDTEASLEPEWSATMSGMRDSPEKLARKDQELSTADMVVVASTFTRKTLELAPDRRESIVVVPYGAPELCDKPTFKNHGSRLRILFVGALGQRKGLSYLLKAVALLGTGVALTLLGRKTAENCDPLNKATRMHNWIPSLPHSEVLNEMGQHDVLVFPSLFEGFGLVILEAMSQGIPVITTPNTAGPDVIRDGENGFIVPIRSAETIAARLENLASDSRRLEALKEAAYRTAKTYTWGSYRDHLARAVRGTISGCDHSRPVEASQTMIQPCSHMDD